MGSRPPLFALPPYEGDGERQRPSPLTAPSVGYRREVRARQGIRFCRDWALWETLLWRVVLVGVLVGERGIKIRGLLRTHVVAWPDVERVWAGPAAAYDAWQPWVSTPGRDLGTLIWRKGSRARHRNRIVLSPEEFASVLNVPARGVRERNTT